MRVRIVSGLLRVSERPFVISTIGDIYRVVTHNQKVKRFLIAFEMTKPLSKHFGHPPQACIIYFPLIGVCYNVASRKGLLNNINKQSATDNPSDGLKPE